MSNWKKCRLGDACVTNTYTYSPKEDWGFVNYLDTGNITDNRIDSIQYIDVQNEKLPSRARRKVKTNSIIYSTVRPNQRHFGIIKTQPENFLVSTGFAVIDVNDKVLNPDFVYYSLTQDTIVKKLHAIAEQSTSAYPSIKPSDIEDLEIDIPDIATQKKIAEILRCLDDKIGLNNRIIANLEQQAQAIFKHLIADIQEDVPFTSVIQVLGGGTPKTEKKEYWNGEIPFFTPKDVDSPYVLTTEKNITSLGLDNCNSRLYPVNTVFLTARGTVGKISLAGVPMSMNQSCYALIGKNELHQIVVYQYTLETIKNLKHKATGAVFDAIITRDFDTESVPALSSRQLDYYVSVAEPMYKEILNRTFENRNLAALRDALLPKLMSGEIDVSAVKI